jgi:hypothetical protein
MRLLEAAEIEQFNPDEFNDETLARNGWLAVGMAHPFDRIEAGIQSNVVVATGGLVVPSSEGIVFGYPSIRPAAIAAVKNIAYAAGLEPGHAGTLSTDRVNYELLVSPEARAAYEEWDVAAQVVNEHAGYIALADAASFEDGREHGWNAAGTRHSVEYRHIFGLNRPIVNRIIGGEHGLAGLVAPYDHAETRGHLIAARLLPGILGPYPPLGPPAIET